MTARVEPGEEVSESATLARDPSAKSGASRMRMKPSMRQPEVRGPIDADLGHGPRD